MLLSKERKSLSHYLVFWLVICSISAAPSFVLAAGGNSNIPAMILGIGMFVLIYSSINVSNFYHTRIVTKPLLHKALSIGFALRIALTGLTVLSSVPKLSMPFFLICDAFPGMIAVSATQFLLASKATGHGQDFQAEFLPTLVATLIQGFFLSLIILLVSMILWTILILINRFKKPEAGVA